MNGLRAIGCECRILSRGCLNADFEAFQIIQIMDFFLAVHVAEALGA